MCSVQPFHTRFYPCNTAKSASSLVKMPQYTSGGSHAHVITSSTSRYYSNPITLSSYSNPYIYSSEVRLDTALAFARSLLPCLVKSQAYQDSRRVSKADRDRLAKDRVEAYCPTNVILDLPASSNEAERIQHYQKRAIAFLDEIVPMANCHGGGSS